MKNPRDQPDDLLDHFEEMFDFYLIG